ncbi:UBX domain-containing protein 11-like isoform X2 [Entelurus aequoreus]|uniref:UBX domain-containing protein 11-like isoform X2 n=1 Tax=Entelurus aequoreus TaxID=161455 RepID=UPI002B1E8357|nr:UBX domain-containing protein 11-like isoform X2 [Entelurus aequoreus]
MSSPLSMLKKTRRAPLQCESENARRGQNQRPFREPVSPGNPSLAVASPTQPSDVDTTSSKTQIKGASSSDGMLMSAMMQRITWLERKVRSQKEEMVQKEHTISLLKEQLNAHEKSGTQHSGLYGSMKKTDLFMIFDLESGNVESCCSLKRKSQQLQHQVDEMVSFLNDYGLIWVGDKKQGDAAAQTSSLTGDSGARNFHLDFELVLKRIKELNILAGEGESFIQSTRRGAQLARKDPVQLRLYKNGIVMFEGPFRSYQEDSTQQCMQDFMEGYFPSELQSRYPDGVPFEVHDRRDEEFVPRRPWKTFPGKGQTVCETKEASSWGMKALSTNQFLKRLPTFVVKAGRVIDVRDSVCRILQGSSNICNSNSVILVDTPAVQANKDRPSSGHKIVTLKVKSEDGNCTYLLKMGLNETVGHLRQHLDSQRGHDLAGYDIISAYPQHHYDDDCQTLRSCGLTTNVTLLLRGRKRAIDR